MPPIRVHPVADAIRLHDVIHTSRLWIAPDTLSLITRHLPSETLRMFSDFALDFSQVTSGSSSDTDPHDIEILTRVDLFAGLRRNALARLAAIARKAELRAGETVFQHGELAAELSVVTHGAFGVFTSADDEQGEVLVNTRSNLVNSSARSRWSPKRSTQRPCAARKTGSCCRSTAGASVPCWSAMRLPRWRLAAQLSRFALVSGSVPHES